MARRRIPFLALALLIGSRLAAETPAHYIVFTAEAGADPAPVFHRLVTVSSPFVSPGGERPRQAEAGRDFESVAFSVVDASGKALYRDVAAVSTWIRGEFHGEPQGGTRWSIDGHRFPAPRTSFVLRLPAVPGARLVFDGRGKTSFDLDALAASAGSLPLATLTNLPARAVSAKAGSPANRADLLIMGDGYTAAEADKFTADAASLEDQFFGISPYREYKSFVNVISLFTPSAQSGADHPPFLANCPGDNPACCGDTAAQSDPLRGTYVDTALGGRFCSFSIHRLVVVDDAAVLAAASAVPNWDRILVLVNDATYGGSGGPLLVSSLHPQAPDIIRHEYGHSFTGLADEYDTPFPGFPACSDVSGRVPCEPNVTDQTNPARLKWEPWVAASTPLPTPEGSAAFTHQTGLFQGARYLASGMYRHRDAGCLMVALGQPFRDVCSQEYVLRLYRGGWGVPAAGIDPIEPGSESPRPGAVPAASSLTFSVRLLQPSNGPALSVRWLVDGVQVPGATGTRFEYQPASAGSHVVELKVRDASSFVHPTLAGTDLESTRRWTVADTAAPSVNEISLSDPTPTKAGP